MRIKLSLGLMLALLVSTANAQEIIVPEGDTLHIRIVTGTDTVEVPGSGCPDGWTCTPPTQPPVIPDPDTTAILDIVYDHYNSTNELRNDFVTFAKNEDLNRNKIFLDGNAMRYDWTDQGISSHSIGRSAPADSFDPRLREAWIEQEIKWSTNFTTCNPAKTPCDHKTMFMQVQPDGNGRWSIHVGGGGSPGPDAWITVSAPRGIHPDKPNEVKFFASTGVHSNQYFDGQWHTIRWHVKHSTNGQTLDGEIDLWMDGVLLGSFGGFSTEDNSAAIRRIMIGRNKDKGQDEGVESMWVGRSRVWSEDPGW